MRYVDKEQGVKNQEENNEIQQEQKSQLNYLVNCVKQLRQRLDKERQAHKLDNIQVMENNTKLIQEIGELRGQIEKLQKEFNDDIGSKKLAEVLKKREENDLRMERINDLEKQGGSQAQIDDQLENMEGFDPKLQSEIQKKREYVESLKQ